jgi:hypothetical protein
MLQEEGYIDEHKETKQAHRISQRFGISHLVFVAFRGTDELSR